MRQRGIANGLVLMLAGLLLGGLTSCASTDQSGGQAGGMPMDEQAMMEKFKAYSTPGSEHGLLARRVGSWDFVAKFWMNPAAPPEESTGASEVKSILGGRFIADETTGTWHGEQFKGLGIIGYDNIQKKYTGVWIDNMGTGMMKYEGQASPDGGAISYEGEFSCPINDGVIKNRSVENYIDENTMVMEAYMTSPDGQEFKHMEITYTRKQ